MFLSRSRVKGLLIEIGIAVGIVGAIVFSAERFPQGVGIDVKWFGLIANTVLVFGTIINWAGPRRRSRAFQMKLFAALVVHSVAYSAVLSRVETWPLMLYIASDVFEWAVIAPLVIGTEVVDPPRSARRG